LVEYGYGNEDLQDLTAMVGLALSNGLGLSLIFFEVEDLMVVMDWTSTSVASNYSEEQ
jgi:hypothetical protein